MFDPVSPETVRATVRKALEVGFPAFDTAPHYGLGLSEERLGSALQGVSASAMPKIWSKVGRVIRKRTELTPEEKSHVEESNCAGHPDCIFPSTPPERVPVLDYSARGMRESHRGSLERIQVPRLHGLRLHDAEVPSRFDKATAASGGGVDELVAMRSEGLIQDVGLGFNNPEYILAMLRSRPAGTFDSVMMAGRWNLIDQSGLGVLLECQRQNIAVHNAGIFGSGLLVGGSTLNYAPAPPEMLAKRDRWGDLAKKYGLSLPALAMAFAFLPEAITKVAIGVKSPKEVELNISTIRQSAVPRALWKEAHAHPHRH